MKGFFRFGVLTEILSKIDICPGLFLNGQIEIQWLWDCGQQHIVKDKENAENLDIEKHEESAAELQDVGR